MPPRQFRVCSYAPKFSYDAKGHHFPVQMRLHEQFTKRGFQFEVITSKNIDKKEYNCHVSQIESSINDSNHYYKISKVRKITKELKTVFSRSDLIIFSEGNLSQLLSILSTILTKNIFGKKIIFNTHKWFDFVVESNDNLKVKRLARMSLELGGKLGLTLCSETSELAKELELAISRPIHRYPIFSTFTATEIVGSKRNLSHPQDILVVVQTRDDFEVFLGILNEIDEPKKSRIRVVYRNGTEKDRKELDSISIGYLFGELSRQDYVNQISGSKITILFYTFQYYSRYGSSGRMLDAIELKRFVGVPRLSNLDFEFGTHAQQYVRNFEFNPKSVNQLIDFFDSMNPEMLTLDMTNSIEASQFAVEKIMNIFDASKSIDSGTRSERIFLSFKLALILILWRCSGLIRRLIDVLYIRFKSICKRVSFIDGVEQLTKTN